MAYNRTIQHFTTALDLVSPWLQQEVTLLTN
jgi:hypothetical protein